MDGNRTIEQGVARARRRLWLDRAVAAWPWCGCVALLVVAAVVVVDRHMALSVLVPIAAASSLVAAFSWAWLWRGDRLAAAVELDRRCGLDERVSSAIALGSTGANDSVAAEAVRIDAERRLTGVDLVAAFPLRVSRRWALPLLPGLAALAAALMIAPSRPVADQGQPTAKMPHVVAATKALEQKLAEKKQTAESLKLAEARRLLEKLETEARKLSADPRLDTKESLIKLNDLAKQIEERRRLVAAPDAVREQLAKLRPKEPGPADDLARSLRRGEFLEGVAEIGALEEQLKSNSLDAAQRDQLAKQLGELSDQLSASVEAPARRDSDDPTKKLQQALGAAADGLKDGRDAAAESALGDLKKQIGSLAAEQAETKLLDEGLMALAECKSGLRRDSEPGPGRGDAADEKPGHSLGPGEASTSRDGKSGGTKPGAGTTGRESLTREEKTQSVEARVRTELGDGPLRVVGPSDGPNAKGRAPAAIREQAAAVADGAPAQPIVNEPLDRSRRAQKRQYFDSLRE